MNQLQFWKSEKLVNGAMELTLTITGVWQCRPFDSVEISEEEFNHLKKVSEQKSYEKIIISKTKIESL